MHSSGSFRAVWEKGLLGGVTTLKHSALRPGVTYASMPLYGDMPKPKLIGGEITLIPYFAFQNRETTAMQVWIPVR